MCGIFGIVINDHSLLSTDNIQSCMKELFVLSESRGKEASGVATRTSEGIQVYKTPVAASEMIRTPDYKNILKKAVQSHENGSPLAIIGHSRLVTNGNQVSSNNNQPVIKDGMVLVHNGIVVNVNELWKKYSDIQCESELDSEIIPALIKYYQVYEQDSFVDAVKKSFYHVDGTVNIALLDRNNSNLFLATNNGSLYICFDKANEIFLFASEYFILKNLVSNKYMNSLFNKESIRHVEAGEGLVIELSGLAEKSFRLDQAEVIGVTEIEPIEIEDVKSQEVNSASQIPRPVIKFNSSDYSFFNDQFNKVKDAISAIKRCKKCVLPETIPYIQFDENEVCNFCRSYSPIELTTQTDLKELLKPYRKDNSRPDCLVAFSGGRDSSYGLDYIKSELGMKPIAYTYDWGMITDLARRNQSRMCGKLGVEHILVSADINKKRANIKANVSAWLKKPDLGMVPLFMAGDKQFFYYASEIAKQNDIKLIILSENLLEKTYFKSGFCGVSSNFNNRTTYSLGMSDKCSMIKYYGNQYISNPSYINMSLIDTIGAFISYYLIPHNFLWLYNYISWNESVIDEALLNNFEWETAVDTDTTWRIGDGTAPFYNYIYYIMAGFTENDTFRSNQIREGTINRDEAVKLVEKENLPRYESIQWYCDTIGLSTEDVLKVIHNAPKRYSV